MQRTAEAAADFRRSLREMKKTHTFLIALLIATSAFADSITNRLVGTWSNKKESFYICTLSFRADGRGVINAGGVAGGALRWREADAGIAITIAAPPENPTIHARLSGESGQLTLALPKSETQTFWRVSTQEPPDFEEQAKVENQKRYDRHRSKRVTTTNSLDTAAAVSSFAAAFAASPSNQYAQARIRLGPERLSVRLHKVSTQTSVTFTSVWASREIPEKAPATGAYAKSPPEGDFAIETLVPKEPADLFMQWLEDREIKCERAYYHYKTMWGIKGYSQFCAAYIKDDPVLVGDTITFLMEQVFVDAKPPYEVVETRKK